MSEQPRSREAVNDFVHRLVFMSNVLHFYSVLNPIVTSYTLMLLVANFDSSHLLAEPTYILLRASSVLGIMICKLNTAALTVPYTRSLGIHANGYPDEEKSCQDIQCFISSVELIHRSNSLYEWARYYSQ